MNYSDKKVAVRNFLNSSEVRICILNETKILARKCTRAPRKIQPDWSFVDNYDHDDHGRIWVGWNPSLYNFQKVNCTDQFVHCRVQRVRDDFNFFVTSIYASNDAVKRVDLWNDLISMPNTIDGPWLVSGDFNMIRYPSEKRGGNQVPVQLMDEFNNCIQSCGLTDIPTISDSFFLEE